MDLVGIMHNEFVPGDDPPDFEALLHGEGSASHQTVYEIKTKIQSRVRVLGLILTYWTPTRLETEAARYAIAWHGTPELAKQFEAAYLHYLNLYRMTPSNLHSETTELWQSRTADLDFFAQMLREARERVEFMFHRAAAIRVSGKPEHIASTLLRQETELIAKKLREALTQFNEEPGSTQFTKRLSSFLSKFPEIRLVSDEERLMLGNLIKREADNRGNTMIPRRLAALYENPASADSTDEVYTSLRSIFPLEEIESRGQP